MAFVVHPITDGFSSSSSLPSISRSQRMRKLFSRKCQGTVEMSRCWQSRNVPTSVLPAAEVVMKTMKHHDVRGPEETVHQLPQTHSPSLSLRLWVARWGLVKHALLHTSASRLFRSKRKFGAGKLERVTAIASGWKSMPSRRPIPCSVFYARPTAGPEATVGSRGKAFTRQPMLRGEEPYVTRRYFAQKSGRNVSLTSFRATRGEPVFSTRIEFSDITGLALPWMHDLRSIHTID
jgi:hypothetical protein